jgi:hypothetical protein
LKIVLIGLLDAACGTVVAKELEGWFATEIVP